jgi:predicted DCC family thiol-disulfide oxidoreductase YuxK
MNFGNYTGQVVLFDGYCNICNRLINILIRLDRKKKLKYASLQGEFAKSMGMSSTEIPDKDSVIFYSNGSLSYETDALLDIAMVLGFPYNALLIMKIIPAAIRKRIYRYFASKRYHWFGRSETCRIPGEEEKALFLD